MGALHTDGRMTYLVREDESAIYCIGDPQLGPHAQGDIAINEVDLRRLVACWNACQGLSTEALEAFAAQPAEGKVPSGLALFPLNPPKELLEAFQSGFQTRLHQKREGRPWKGKDITAEQAGLLTMLRVAQAATKPLTAHEAFQD